MKICNNKNKKSPDFKINCLMLSYFLMVNFLAGCHWLYNIAQSRLAKIRILFNHFSTFFIILFLFLCLTWNKIFEIFVIFIFETFALCVQRPSTQIRILSIYFSLYKICSAKQLWIIVVSQNRPEWNIAFIL